MIRARLVPRVFTLHYTRGHLCPRGAIWVTVNRSLGLVQRAGSLLGRRRAETMHLAWQNANPSAEEESHRLSQHL